MQNIDKIAYVVVGLIVIGLCALAFMAGEGGATAEVNELLKDIEGVAASQEVKPQRADDLRAELEAQLPSAEGAGFAEWSFYRKPTRVELKEEVIRIAATHKSPRICRVESMRDNDLKRSIVKVGGLTGDSEHIKNGMIYLEGMAEGGDWEVMGEQVAVPGEEHEFVLDNLTLGTQYKFRIRSTAESATSVALSPSAKELTSEESDLVLVPLDEYLRCSSAQAADFGNAGFRPGNANLVWLYWDYSKGRIQRKQQTVYEANPDKGQNWKTDGKTVFDTKLRLEGIKKKKQPDGKQGLLVTLRDPDNFRASKRELWAGAKAPPMESTPWENPAGCADEEEDMGDGMDEGTGDMGAGDGAGDSEPTDDDDDDLFGGDG
ncbi:MAG: fibronectin type III domain-containing protein [Planctomycetota bacterium]